MGDQDIPGGSNYTKEITAAIRKCQVFLLVLSRNAQDSVYVFKELDYAVKRNKIVIPYMLEDFEPRDEFDFLLSGCQRIFAHTDKTSAHEALLRQIQSIKENPSVQHPKNETPNARLAQSTHRRTRRVITCPRCKSIKMRDWISVREYLMNEPDLLELLSIIITGLLLCISTYIYVTDCDIHGDVLHNFNTFMDQVLSTYIENENIRIILTKLTKALLCGVATTILVSLIPRMIKALVALCQHRRYLMDIRIWTFQCCNCNKKLRVTIPIKEQSKYHIREYVKTEHPSLTQQILDYWRDKLTERN